MDSVRVMADTNMIIAVTLVEIWNCKNLQIVSLAQWPCIVAFTIEVKLLCMRMISETPLVTSVSTVGTHVHSHQHMSVPLHINPILLNWWISPCVHCTVLQAPNCKPCPTACLIVVRPTSPNSWHLEKSCQLSDASWRYGGLCRLVINYSSIILPNPVAMYEAPQHYYREQGSK